MRYLEMYTSFVDTHDTRTVEAHRSASPQYIPQTKS
jgi:hypothetical protein